MENQIRDVSKRCNPRPKPQDLRLTWARASAYKNRVAGYSKLPHLAPDRILEIARHYRTSPLTAFASVFLTLTSGAMTTVPFDLARANDCLGAPNSPAPKGSHWYYRLNRETQQKCWYVRSSEKQPQRATVRATSIAVAVPSTRAGPISSAVSSGTHSSSGQLEPSTSATQDPASNTVSNSLASAPQEDIQPSALRGNASSDASGQVTATTAVAWPEPAPVAPSVTPRDANAAAVDAIMNPVSDTADSIVGNGEQTSKFEIPIAVFPALAIGLLVIGFGVRLIMKDYYARRVQTVDHTGGARISEDDHIRLSHNRPADGSTVLKEDDFQLFVSAISDHAPPESTVSSVRLTKEIGRREAKLARLRDDIDRCLGWAEPTQGLAEETSSLI
jgi:hypothetical protein